MTLNKEIIPMATIQCPYCKHEASVPSLDRFIGKNVKCPSCKQNFRAEAEPTASAFNPDDDVKLQDPVQKTPFPSPPLVRTSTPPTPNAGMRSSYKNSLFSSLTNDPNGATSDKRYPNLLRYIGIAETLTKVFFWIGIVCVALSLLGWEIQLLVGIGPGNLTVVESLEMMVLGPLIAGLYVLILWLWFILAMAMTEFVRVIIDIENNTRN